MKLTGAVFAILAVVGLVGPVSAQQLTCNYPMYDDPGATHRFTVEGSAVHMTYGANNQFSLVGTEFILALPGQPSTAVNFCEARSAAGAGWQHTEFTGAYGGAEFICNQAAGNALGYQWGYQGTLWHYDTPTLGYITGSQWLPAYYDTFDAGSGHEPKSPCAGNSAFFNNLKRAVAAAPQDDGNGGEVVSLTNNTTLESAVNQYWAWDHNVDAYYFDRAVARDQGMVVFMKGQGGWQVGPLFIYDNWDEDDLKDQNGVVRGTMLPTPPWGGSWCEIDSDVEQVTFCVWVGGQRMAFGMRNLPDGFTLRMVEEVYCDDASDDSCGSIDMIVYHGGVLDPSYPIGTQRQYELTWKIGTTAQLSGLGYWCY